MSPTPGDSTTPNVVNLLTPNNKGNSPTCQFVLNKFSIDDLFLVSLNFDKFPIKTYHYLGFKQNKRKKKKQIKRGGRDIEMIWDELWGLEIDMI